jgi:hypothetical protein
VYRRSWLGRSLLVYEHSTNSMVTDTITCDICGAKDGEHQEILFEGVTEPGYRALVEVQMCYKAYENDYEQDY